MTNRLSPKERVKIPRQKMPEQAPAARRQNFQEVNLGLAADAAATEALRCIECADPKCVKGCPVGVKVREFVDLVLKQDYKAAAAKMREDNVLPAVTGRVCPQEDQCEGACVMAQEVRPARDRVSGTLHRRLGGGLGRARTAATRAAHGPQGGLRRQRAGVPHRGRRPGAEGPRRDGVRGAARDRRRPRLRHPRVPPAQGHRPPRDRKHGEDGRALRDERGRRAHRHDRRADAAGGLRRRVRGHRRRPPEVPRRAGREPERRLLGERVPLARQPDAGLPLPRVRRADLRLPRQERRRRRRRQHRARRHPHRAAPRRLEGDDALPPLRGRDAGTRGGDPPRQGRGRRDPDPHPPRRLPRRRAGLAARGSLHPHGARRARRLRAAAARSRSRARSSRSRSTSRSSQSAPDPTRWCNRPRPTSPRTRRATSP